MLKFVFFSMLCSLEAGLAAILEVTSNDASR